MTRNHLLRATNSFVKTANQSSTIRSPSILTSQILHSSSRPHSFASSSSSSSCTPSNSYSTSTSTKPFPDSPLPSPHHDPPDQDTGFNTQKRDALKLRGLLPAIHQSMELQVMRCLHQMRSKKVSFESSFFHSSLPSKTNQPLFFNVDTSWKAHLSSFSKTDKY